MQIMKTQLLASMEKKKANRPLLSRGSGVLHRGTPGKWSWFPLKRRSGSDSLWNIWYKKKRRLYGEFACDCIKDWWKRYGERFYPKATSILILADGGGSNSSRYYIFKEDLQKLVNDIGIEIRMAHYPPYTSKYNPIEHRMFCHVTRACGKAVFTSVEMLKWLMEKASTSTGLKVFASITDKVYKTARKASADFKAKMPILVDASLGQWNYRAVPQMGEKSGLVF